MSLTTEQLQEIENEKIHVESLIEGAKQDMDDLYEVLKDIVLYDAKISILRTGVYFFNLENYKDVISEKLKLDGEHLHVSHAESSHWGWDDKRTHVLWSSIHFNDGGYSVVGKQYSANDLIGKIERYLSFNGVVKSKYSHEYVGVESIKKDPSKEPFVKPKAKTQVDYTFIVLIVGILALLAFIISMANH